MASIPCYFHFSTNENWASFVATLTPETTADSIPILYFDTIDNEGTWLAQEVTAISVNFDGETFESIEFDNITATANEIVVEYADSLTAPDTLQGRFYFADATVTSEFIIAIKKAIE